MQWIENTIAKRGRGAMKGRQIRSYFLSPHGLVVDHRTGIERLDADAVLDGEIDRFMIAELERRHIFS